MGVCVDKLPHSCGTSKGLQIFYDAEKDSYNGYCFACSTFVSNPYGDTKPKDLPKPKEAKTEEEVQAELAEISSYPVVDLRHRKLRADVLGYFGIKIAMSESDGKTPVCTYFPITKEGRVSGYYAKTIGEKSYEWSVGDVREGDLFGWQQAVKSGAYKLVIVEGREDAVATRKIHELHGKKEYTPAVVSLSNGVNSVEKNLNRHAVDITRLFKEVVICFDDDEPGKKATEKALLILPQAKTTKLPCKDPNDCLIEGVSKAAFTAFAHNATTQKNTTLIMGSSLHRAAREPTPYGELTWPFPTMNKMFRNLRLGETIYAGAGVKMGKSQLVDQLAAHFITKDNVPVFMAKPEEANKKTYKQIAGKVAGTTFVDPDVDFDFEAYDQAGAEIQDKLMLINLYQHLSWDVLKRDIIHSASMGAKVAFIDPITNLTNGEKAADANTILSEISQDLSSMALDLNMTVFIFCHLKAHEGTLGENTRVKAYKNKKYIGLGNCAHEWGGDIYSSQFAGSRAMMRSCNLMIGLEGNKDPELPEHIRNRRNLKILEDREFGNSGVIPLFWDKHTTRFKEL